MRKIEWKFDAPKDVPCKSLLFSTRYIDQELDHLEKVIKYSCACRLKSSHEAVELSYWEERLRLLTVQASMIPSQHGRIRRLHVYLATDSKGPAQRSALEDKLPNVRRRDARQYKPATHLETGKSGAYEAAKTEIMSGRYWKIVAHRYNIKAEYLLLELEEISAFGPAMTAVLKGKDWREVADDHGIITGYLRTTLENGATECAKVEVLSGINWKIAADRRRITSASARASLERVAAYDLAAKEIMAGAKWQVVADRHSIASPSLRANLENTSALGPAKEQVLLGHSWEVVAEHYGITDLYLMALLSEAHSDEPRQY